MSASAHHRSIPGPTGQRAPRAVRLAPSGIYGPASIFRFALSRSGRADVIYSGHLLEPLIRDGSSITVEPRQRINPGDLVLCEVDQVGDIRRIVRTISENQYLTAINALPGRFGVVPLESILGVVEHRVGAGGRVGAAIARVFPVWSRMAACIHWLTGAMRASAMGERAQSSVKERYAHQAEAWQKAQEVPIGPEFEKWMEGHVRKGTELLVVGCGAGREALHLAQCGWKVTGIDFVPEMIDAARRRAALQGVEARFVSGDVVSLDLPGEKFGGVYLTPFVYSYIQGRIRRVSALKRLQAHLAQGARIVLIADPVPNLLEYVRSFLCWTWSRLRGNGAAEFGDWYQDFLTADGRLGRSFVHRFGPGEVAAEIECAGLRVHSETASGTYVASSGGAH